MQAINVLDGLQAEAQVRNSRVDRVSHLINDVLSDDGDENLVYLNVMVPPSHKALLRGLSKVNRVKMAASLRAIIDEWCESKQVAHLDEDVA